MKLLIGYIFSFSACFFSSALERKEKNQVTVTYRRLEKKKSTYLRKKRGNIYYYSHHQIDASLVQLILSLSLARARFFSSSFGYATALYDVLTCVFFFSSSSSRLFCLVLSLSPCCLQTRLLLF